MALLAGEDAGVRFVAEAKRLVGQLRPIDRSGFPYDEAVGFLAARLFEHEQTARRKGTVPFPRAYAARCAWNDLLDALQGERRHHWGEAAARVPTVNPEGRRTYARVPYSRVVPIVTEGPAVVDGVYEDTGAAEPETDSHQWTDLRDAMLRCPPLDREIFWLHAIDGLSQKEIARRLHLRKAEVGVRIRQVRDMLCRGFAA